ALESLSIARTADAFDDAVNEGLVRIEALPDEDYRPEDWSDDKRDREAYERDGAWGVVTRYLDADGEWRVADSVWGFVGYSSLWDQAKAGTLRAADLIPQAQKLSHEDWTRLFHETIKTDTSTKVSDFPMGKYDDLMKDMIVFPKAQSDFGGNFELAGKDAETSGRITQAQAKFAETVQTYLNDPAFARLSRPEQTTKIRQALDATAQEFGGVTYDKRQAFVEQQEKKAEAASAEAAAKMNGGIEFKDGQGTTGDGKTFGTPTTLTDDMRAQVRTVATGLAASSGNGPRSLEQIYGGKTNRTLWQVLTFQEAKDIRNRDELVLTAFVHNASLLHAGSWSAATPWRVVEDANSARTVSEPHSDVETSAKVNFQRQREELAGVRRRLGETWITDARREELKNLTADIAGIQTRGDPVPATKADRFKDLSENFRLYDFLGVTAGVDRQDVEQDYHTLYKYPAASSVDELIRMGPFFARFVPREEMRAVQEAQRSLIDNAHDLLVNRRYVP
ncbi:MAG: hypothetical protein JWM57_2556, partial [Phycisphaerales bacterium]|nr:hypothetical protein [Phycisphaerales bacterium]